MSYDPQKVTLNLGWSKSQTVHHSQYIFLENCPVHSAKAPLTYVFYVSTILVVLEFHTSSKNKHTQATDFKQKGTP